MCGRFALTLPKDAMLDLFEARPAPGADDALAEIDLPRYNIRPTQSIAVVALEHGARLLKPMRWGFLPHRRKAANDGPLLINARAETIAEKPAFRQACRERRCLIPADGFYEWRAAAGRGKEPYWIHPAAGGPLVFAGVWRTWRGPEDEEIDTVAIVTCAANARMAPLHERLPVAVAAEDFALWLGEPGPSGEPAFGAATLMRAPEDPFYDFHRVSTAINKGGRAAPDGPELIEPADEAQDAPDLLI